MTADTALTGTSVPVEIAPGGYTLLAPNLRGVVRELTPAESATRGDGGLHEGAVLRALSNADVFPVKWFEMEVQDDGSAGTAATGRAGGSIAVTREQEPAVVLRAPVLQANAESAVLYTDEAGITRWIFPESGGTGEVAFHLPRASRPTGAGDASSTRGLISKLGRRLVRVLAWATDDIIGRGACVAARLWESTHRPYALRPLPLGPADVPLDWKALQGGRALLFLHGTFSTARAAFSQLPQAAWDELCRCYGGRLLAFDHPTMHQSPQENAQQFIELLPDDIALEVDVVTHSRGGLVCRELTERLATLRAGGRKLQIRKAVLVASPNLGTQLTDGDHGIALLDRYTNLFTELPDDVCTLSMEGLFALGKLILHGALTGLPGLACMYPPGVYLHRINAGSSATRYYAAAANFRPKLPGLVGRFAGWVGGELLDEIFGEDNDVVVPTRGSYECAKEATCFPIPKDRRLLFAKEDGVHHCNYFGKPALVEKLLDWLN